MKDIKASLVGFGVVGHGILEVIKRKQPILRDLGLDLKVVSISDHTGSIMNEAGVDADCVLKDKTLEKVATSSMKGQEAIKAVDSDLVIEVTPTNVVHGQPGLGHMESALSSGKNLVTSNKGPLVLAFSRLRKLADDNHCQFKYEATVGGTMPLMSLIERTLVGNTIYSIEGIFNGTCNYILTRMAQENISYSHALSEAQDLGTPRAIPPTMWRASILRARSSSWPMPSSAWMPSTATSRSQVLPRSHLKPWPWPRRGATSSSS